MHVSVQLVNIQHFFLLIYGIYQVQMTMDLLLNLYMSLKKIVWKGGRQLPMQQVSPLLFTDSVQDKDKVLYNLALILLQELRTTSDWFTPAPPIVTGDLNSTFSFF